MEPPLLSQLYVVFLVVLWLARTVVIRLAELLWTGIVLGVLGMGFLYASAAVQVGKLLDRFVASRGSRRSI